MRVNEGSTDRMLRGIIGGTLVAMAVMGVIGPWGYVGVLVLATAAAGYCPLYGVLGTTTFVAPAKRTWNGP